MKLLLLGGTGFLGHHIVEAALRCGHEVTLFHRGQTHPDLFPDLDHVQGDREKDLTALSGRYWDAAIDTCGFFPRAVRASAEFLADAVDHYTFISSLNAYAQVKVDGIDESYPVGTLPDETVEEVTPTSYGPLKALCEQAAEHVLPGRVLIIRPGLIVGPSDPQEVTPWSELPLWIPRTLGVGRQAADIRKALDAGLTFRPLTETIHDTLVWDRAHPGTVVQSGSITPGREADLLHAWHMRIHE